MREAIGGTWLFQIVIVFILLFTGFMCLSINRSKAFSVKDRIIQSIQAHNGINLDGYSEENYDAMYDIVEYIRDSSYRNTGVYPQDEKVGEETVHYSCFSKDGAPVDEGSSRKPAFCIAPMETQKEGCNSGDICFNELPKMIYYRVVVFYQLDLPVFHDWFNFKVVGDTKTLYGGLI